MLPPYTFSSRRPLSDIYDNRQRHPIDDDMPPLPDADADEMDVESSDGSGSRASTRNYVIRASSSSSGLRCLVRSAPLLWTKCIPVNIVRFQARRHYNYLVVSHIERALSRSSPLAVPVSLDRKEFRNLEDLMEVLRIGTGSDTEAATCALHALRSIPPDSLQSPTALTITILHNNTPAIPRSPLTFPTAPKLRNVRLFVWWADVVPMPSAQLTHLSLTRACLETLVQCPNVVSAVLGCPYLHLDTPRRTRRDVLPQVSWNTMDNRVPGVHRRFGKPCIARARDELFYPDDDGMVWSSPEKLQDQSPMNELCLAK
ncbi:hypothetical protein R3P38DRAFT_3227305 [Favolaschia claudopus]|uniref:Uncharacterized protein n=1 Tax=Favolaschia claudopus TaxID=2862362 RepID=A0AAV9ZTR4_9AGAR